jgi:hypothetical protein
VARVENGNATGKVNVASPLDIPDFGVFGFGNKDLVALSNATGDGGMAPAHELGVVVRLIHRCKKMS